MVRVFPPHMAIPKSFGKYMDDEKSLNTDQLESGTAENTVITMHSKSL